MLADVTGTLHQHGVGKVLETVDADLDQRAVVEVFRRLYLDPHTFDVSQGTAWAGVDLVAVLAGTGNEVLVARIRPSHHSS